MVVRRRHVAGLHVLVVAIVSLLCRGREFSEHVIIHQLTDQLSAATFAASAEGQPGSHQQDFPLPVAALFDTYPLSDFHITLSRGRWRRAWGAGIGGAPPPGAAFTATWQPIINATHVPRLWNSFTNAVSGLFCSSLSTLSPTSMHFSPRLPPSAWDPFTPPATEAAVLETLRTASAAQVVTGALSQEAVCTENLTGFVKLLPCREQAGIGKLLAPATIFSSPFHTLELRVTERAGALYMRLRVTAVLDHNAHAAIFTKDSPQQRVCPAASPSTAVAIASAASARLTTGETAGDCAVETIGSSDGMQVTACTSASTARGTIFRFPPATKITSGDPSPPALVRVSQHVLSSGDEGGTWLIELARSSVVAAPLLVCTQSAIPWFFQAWLHTLQIRVDGIEWPLKQAAFWWSLEPGQTRESMHIVELCFQLQPVAQRVQVSLELSKTLLHVHEYPPDSHRGLDVASTRVLAAIAGDGAGTQVGSVQRCSAMLRAAWLEPLASDTRQWLAELACRGTHEIFSNSVVVSVATPDFSMPYIVCSLSSSLIAIYAGLVVGALAERRRAAALWALSPKGKRARMLKLAIVCIVFLCLAVYLDTEWQDWVVAQLEAQGVDARVFFKQLDAALHGVL